MLHLLNFSLKKKTYSEISKWNMTILNFKLKLFYQMMLRKSKNKPCKNFCKKKRQKQEFGTPKLQIMVLQCKSSIHFY
jgi:hypothetical protein